MSSKKKHKEANRIAAALLRSALAASRGGARRQRVLEIVLAALAALEAART